MFVVTVYQLNHTTRLQFVERKEAERMQRRLVREGVLCNDEIAEVSQIERDALELFRAHALVSSVAE